MMRTATNLSEEVGGRSEELRYASRGDACIDERDIAVQYRPKLPTTHYPLPTSIKRNF